MADATVIDRLVWFHDCDLGEDPVRRRFPATSGPRKPVRVPGRMVNLRSSTAICPRAPWSTLLLRRVSTRLRGSPDPASARSSNWAYCTCSTRQTTKPAIARTAGLLAPILAPTARHLRSTRRLKRRHRHVRTGFPAVASGSEPLPQVRAPRSDPGGHGERRSCQGMVRFAGILRGTETWHPEPLGHAPSRRSCSERSPEEADLQGFR